jgi:glutamine amidotransferase
VIAIINYGLGNLHSVNKAAAHVGGETVVTDEAQEILSADKVILPGVGAFADGMEGLASRGLVPVIQEVAGQGKPLLGICLGMQLLFDAGEEQGNHTGLGLLPGRVVPFSGSDIKIPQIGWNQIEIRKESYLMNGINNGDYFYFNHSYCCLPVNPGDVLTETNYGTPFASSVNNLSIFGVQFHPEKSQKLGLQIMKNFVELPNG